MGIISRGCNAPRWHELDEVRAAELVLAHAQARLLRTVHNAVLPSGMGQALIKPIARIAVSCGRTERLERYPQPRARDPAVIDGVADRNRLVAAAHIARAR